MKARVAVLVVAFMIVAGASLAVAAGVSPPDLAAELSLVVPVTPTGDGTTFAVFLSGDGGWAELDREVARRLNDADVPVIGWNSRAYYWTRKTPEAAADALGRVIDHYREAWKRPRVVLVGYSRGADVLAFLVNRLTDAQRTTVALVALLGPAKSIDFEFHLTDFLHGPDPKTALAVPPEIEALMTRGGPLLVLYGEKDQESAGPALSARVSGVVAVPGDHHFARDYDRLAQLILASADLTSSAP